MRLVPLALLLFATLDCGAGTESSKNPGESDGDKAQPPIAVATDKQAASSAAKTPDSATVKKHMTRAQLALGDPAVTSIGMMLVPIPAGEFRMGSPDSDGHARGHEKAQHGVKITRPFYLGVLEVTQQQYEKLMGKHECLFPGAKSPVDNVNWTDAVTFCRRLSELPKEKALDHVYRLPTEAEWAYACRAGTSTIFSFGDSESQVGEYAWFKKNSGQTTHPVGQKKPNPWGLYDMHGNVWEWCQDWYGGQYSSDSVTDPKGPRSGKRRVLRGGAYARRLSFIRSASRYSEVPAVRSGYNGFRIARDYP